MEEKQESYEKILESLNYIPKKNVFEKLKDGTKLVSSMIVNAHI